MAEIDVEKLARECGEIAFANGQYSLQKGDVIMSPDALAAYTALVLEEAAKQLDIRARSASTAGRLIHGREDAEHLRTIAEGLKP